MWKTILFLIFTLIVVPVVAYFVDDSLTVLQWDILKTLIWVYVITAALCFVVSTLSKNYSQVDKLWSIIPVAYVWIVSVKVGHEPRSVLMASLVTLWAARLTFNFARRGGYSWKFWSGDEDYRWAELQAKPEMASPIKWFFFNLFFISYYQMGLILLFTLPALKSINSGELTVVDIVLAILFVFFVVLETIADQQQWKFQSEKYRRIRRGEALGEVYAKGFTHRGLWALVRHPNYASEQAIWITFYCFSIVATGHWINWSMVGALLLVVLFKGSSDFSEAISASKYEAYKEYQRTVPRFVPWTKWK